MCVLLLSLGLVSPTWDSDAPVAEETILRVRRVGSERYAEAGPRKEKIGEPWRDRLLEESDGSPESFRTYLEKLASALTDGKVPRSWTVRRRRLTWRVDEGDPKRILEKLALAGRVRIIAPPRIEGAVSVFARNALWDEILLLVVRECGLVAVRERSNVIRVIHPDEHLRQMETRVYRIRRRALDRKSVVQRILESVLTRDPTGRALGRLDFDPQTKSFIVQDTKKKLDCIGRILELLDDEPR